MKYLPMAALLVTLPLTVLASSPPAQAQIRLGIEFPVPVEPYYFSPGYCEGCWHGTWEGREGWHRGGGHGQSNGHKHEGHR